MHRRLGGSLRWRRRPARCRVVLPRRRHVAQLDDDGAPRFAKQDVSRGGEFLREIAKAARSVGSFGKRRVELQQRALQQPQLRRYLAIREYLERAANQRQRLLDGRLRNGRGLAAALLRAARADKVLVGDELVAVA